MIMDMYELENGDLVRLRSWELPSVVCSKKYGSVVYIKPFHMHDRKFVDIIMNAVYMNKIDLGSDNCESLLNSLCYEMEWRISVRGHVLYVICEERSPGLTDFFVLKYSIVHSTGIGDV